MRKLIVCNFISLDGYYEGPGTERHGHEHGQGFRRV